VVLEQSTLRTSYGLSGHAAGHLTLQVPGEKALIDTYVVVTNDEEVVQGSLNSTLRWSTSSSWQNNGDIYFFGDLQALDFSEEQVETESYLGAPFTASNTNYAYQNTTDYEVVGCPGERIYVDLCDDRATCNGDTYINLLSPEGYYVTSNNNACGLCSSIAYSVPESYSECMTYTAKLGCYSMTACSGTPLFRTTVANHTKWMKSWRVRETLTYGDNQYHASSYLFEGDAETLSAYGEGQYLIENGYKW
jgi:hypothetical protein